MEYVTFNRMRIKGETMKLIESLEFIFEREEFLSAQFGIAKRDVLEALDGLYGTISWLKQSIFQSVLKDVTFFFSDEPINFPGELELYESEKFEPIIYVNIMTVVEDFYKREFVLEMNKETATCYEYAAFVCLHEFGHLVHGLIGGTGELKRDRLLDYFERGQYYYERFIAFMNQGDTMKEKKRYRNIPHEKAADSFARQYVPYVLLDRSIE